MLKHLTVLLLLTLGAIGVVNANVASGSSPLCTGWSRAGGLDNRLVSQEKIESGYNVASGCADAAKAADTAERGLWTVTRGGTARVVKHGTFGKFYKSASDGLWWSKDMAGHGGSEWKVFRESSKGLEWYRDANKYGDFILNKHKSDVGQFIPWKDLHGSGF